MTLQPMRYYESYSGQLALVLTCQGVNLRRCMVAYSDRVRTLPVVDGGPQNTPNTADYVLRRLVDIPEMHFAAADANGELLPGMRMKGCDALGTVVFVDEVHACIAWDAVHDYNIRLMLMTIAGVKHAIIRPTLTVTVPSLPQTITAKCGDKTVTYRREVGQLQTRGAP